MRALPGLPSSAAELSATFFGGLASLRVTLLLDAEVTLATDPAARDLAEVLGTYAGFYATALHRLAHALYQSGVPGLPRLLSAYAHHQTGIDIHPAARIGPAFCIDLGSLPGISAVMKQHKNLRKNQIVRTSA